MGTTLYTGGRVPLSISLGAFSYDFTHQRSPTMDTEYKSKQENSKRAYSLILF
jgi:hypothetical protein